MLASSIFFFEKTEVHSGVGKREESFCVLKILVYSRAFKPPELLSKRGKNYCLGMLLSKNGSVPLLEWSLFDWWHYYIIFYSLLFWNSESNQSFIYHRSKPDFSWREGKKCYNKVILPIWVFHLTTICIIRFCQDKKIGNFQQCGGDWSFKAFLPTIYTLTDLRSWCMVLFKVFHLSPLCNEFCHSQLCSWAVSSGREFAFWL